MASSDKNFVRNICLAAGLFFAFLLISPVKFGPLPPQNSSERDSILSDNVAVNITTPDSIDIDALALNEDVKVPDAATNTSSEFLGIPLTIGENRYMFNILRNKENVLSLAEEVCNENAQTLGLAPEQLSTQCYEPVAASLREQVDLTLEQVIPVDLDIDGRSVQFEIDSALSTSTEDQAEKFCTNYGFEFGVTRDTLAECVHRVKGGLNEKIAAARQEMEKKVEETGPMFQLDLDIQGRSVRFEVEANYESIGEQANNFCATHGPEFGVTQESLGECQQNVRQALKERIVAYLQTQQTRSDQPTSEEQAAPADPTYQLDLDIHGRTVRFNVEGTYESIGEQANNFCATHGPEFGVTQESLGECQQNVRQALEERIVAHLSTN